MNLDYLSKPHDNSLLAFIQNKKRTGDNGCGNDYDEYA
jgi:hypothetical protein